MSVAFVLATSNAIVVVALADNFVFYVYKIVHTNTHTHNKNKLVENPN